MTERVRPPGRTSGAASIDDLLKAYVAVVSPSPDGAKTRLPDVTRRNAIPDIDMGTERQAVEKAWRQLERDPAGEGPWIAKVPGSHLRYLHPDRERLVIRQRRAARVLISCVEAATRDWYVSLEQAIAKYHELWQPSYEPRLMFTLYVPELVGKAYLIDPSSPTGMPEYAFIDNSRWQAERGYIWVLAHYSPQANPPITQYVFDP